MRISKAFIRSQSDVWNASGKSAHALLYRSQREGTLIVKAIEGRDRPYGTRTKVDRRTCLVGLEVELHAPIVRWPQRVGNAS